MSFHFDETILFPERRLVELYASVRDQRAADAGMLAGAWENSRPRLAAFEDGRLVGLARGLCDDHTTLFLCDLLVHPDFQGRGLASELLRRLVAPYADLYQIALLTDPETLPFYVKRGFLHWPSACMRMNRPK